MRGSAASAHRDARGRGGRCAESRPLLAAGGGRWWVAGPGGPACVSKPWHRSATCSRGDGSPPFCVLNGRRARTPTCVLAAACPRSELRGKEWSAFLPLRGIIYRAQTVLCESSEKPLSPLKGRVNSVTHLCVPGIKGKRLDERRLLEDLA